MVETVTTDITALTQAVKTAATNAFDLAIEINSIEIFRWSEVLPAYGSAVAVPKAKSFDDLHSKTPDPPRYITEQSFGKLFQIVQWLKYGKPIRIRRSNCV